MIEEYEVESFLHDFKVKLNTFDIRFRDDRGKNTNTLLALEIPPNYRVEIIKTLSSQDYSEGPIPEIMNNNSPMWVFGKEVKGEEIYIKITMGKIGRNVICISFHIAEHPMIYPFK